MSKYQQIFIVGLHRGGTSEMFRLCTSVLDYRGVIEGHVWPVFRAVVDEVEATVARLGGRNSEAYKGFLIGQWGADRIKDQVFNLFNAQHAQRFGDRWVDKTPGHEMVRCIPVLARRFPKAGFIFMRRRPVENILSRFRRFGRHDFSVACGEWEQTMRAWLEVRDVVGQRSIEVDQQAMALAPARTAQRLSDFLDLSEEASEGISTFLRTSRTEQTQIPSSRPIAVEDTEWSASDKQIFRKICGEVAAKYGYDLDATEFDFPIEPQTIHFNFTANAPGVSVHSPKGETYFHPMGLRLSSGGPEEFVEVTGIAFQGQDRLVTRVFDTTNLLSVTVLITLASGEQMEQQFSGSGDATAVAEFPPLHGSAVVRVSVRGNSSAPVRIDLHAPHFERGPLGTA